MIASYESNIAIRFSRMVCNDIIARGDEVDMRVSERLAREREWQIAGRLGGMYVVGLGGALTSRPVGLLITDDPSRGFEQAASETY